MEELNLKKAIKELKKQIKAQEKKCEKIETLVEKQSEEDSKAKEVELLNLENKINDADLKREDARRIHRVTFKISAGSFIAYWISLFSSVILTPLLSSNLVWLPWAITVLSMISFIPAYIMYAKKHEEIKKQKNIIQEAFHEKDKIISKTSEKLSLLEKEQDREYQILRELRDDYKTLTKYANKKEPVKIEKAETKIKKAKTLKENKVIEEDSDLLNQ